MLQCSLMTHVSRATKKRNSVLRADGRTLQVGSVSQDIFFLSCGKNESLKTQKSPIKCNGFSGEKMEKYFQLFSKIFYDMPKTDDFTWFQQTKRRKKNLPKWKSVSVMPLKQGCLFSWPRQVFTAWNLCFSVQRSRNVIWFSYML